MTLVTMNAEAIPAFASQTNMTCATCHFQHFPTLNAFGRSFKQGAYTMVGGQSLIQSDNLSLPVALNASLVTKLRYQKTNGTDKAIATNTGDLQLPDEAALIIGGRGSEDVGLLLEASLKESGADNALHEVELMVAGLMGEKFSSFIEIEAEDLNARGVETGISSAALTCNADEAAHLQVSWGSITWFDPYNSYSNYLRMTRGASAVYDQSFGGADNGGKTKSARQNITVYGWPSPNFFYGISLSGDAGDAEGEEGNTITTRVAFDVMPSLTVGALVISGTANASSIPDTVGIVAGNPAVIPDSTTPERDYSRTAIDLQSEVAGFTFNAVFLTAMDDNSGATAEVDNDAFYVQALYTVKDGAHVTWAPLIRFDSYETGGGAVDIDEITLSINYYFTENVRGMLELWDRDSSAAGKDDDRITAQVIAAF